MNPKNKISLFKKTRRVINRYLIDNYFGMIVFNPKFSDTRRIEFENFYFFAEF